MNSTELKIISSFIKLLGASGIERITVSEICAEAGVSKRSFYNHFRDKFDILNKVQAIPELENDDDISLAALEDYFRKRYKWLLEHRNFLRNISFYYGQNSSILQFRDSVRDLLWKVMLRDNPGLEKTAELDHAVEYFAYSYLIFVIRILLLDPDFCDEYFHREHFIGDYIPPILLPYLHY